MYKALISFCNEELDIAQGEILASDFASAEVIADLLAAGYIEEYTDPSGGAKIEVVTELPETGEANVIYLVPKQDEDENNVFDEYLYVNNEWELIGTTDIDLSGYQPLLTAGDNITIDNNNVISASGSDIPTLVLSTAPNRYWGGGSLTSPQQQKIFDFFGNRINEMLTENPKNGLILIKYEDSPKEEIWVFNDTLNTTSTMFRFYILNNATIQGDKSTYEDYLYSVRGFWDNGVFVCNNITCFRSPSSFVTSSQVLTKDNSNSYTPTANYHPATKKYVDDSIAAAITTTLGGNY